MPIGTLTNGAALRAPAGAWRLALWVCFLAWFAIVWLGLDFGKHWDERVALRVTAEMMARHHWLPSTYVYPSFMFELIALGSLPDYVIQRLSGLSSPDAWRAAVQRLEGASNLLELRALFALLAGCSLLFAGRLARTLSGRSGPALLAALLLAGSWEFAYHARWVACDALVACWATLALALLIEAASRESRGYLLAGAAVAGLATASKYPAGVLAIPVLLAALVHTSSLRRRVISVLLGGMVFSAAYLVVTPGMLLDSPRFVADLTREMAHYEKGHPGGHSVTPGLPHLGRMLEYFACAGLSPQRECSLAAFALACFGALSLCRERPRQALVLLSAPLAFVVYMSLRNVFIVRNLIWLLPLGAACAAHGAYTAWRLAQGLRRPRTRLIAAWSLSACLTAPGLVLGLGAALSIRDVTPPAALLGAYLQRNPQPSLQVTARFVRQLRSSSELSRIPRFERNRPASMVAALSSEVARSKTLAAYRHDSFPVVLGAREVNLNYYPTWAGREHVLLLTHAQAVELGLR